MKRKMKYMVACLALLIIGSALAGFTFSSGALKAETTSTLNFETRLPQVDEIRDYRRWTKVNPQPTPISSVAVAVLCRMPTANDDMHDAGRSPHVNKLITVYVNELGRQAMMTELRPQFPVGSVIVKEKLSADKMDAPELLTVMVKRERGFNPAVGDWEFMAVNGAGTKIDARGRLESCQSCHVLMKERDFVSRSYLPDELRSKLR
ncbi:MAG TPA: cytochrome P460 family protein [Pyrinomonadaceae bacterium]|jgi:hypothetical protein